MLTQRNEKTCNTSEKTRDYIFSIKIFSNDNYMFKLLTSISAGASRERVLNLCFILAHRGVSLSRSLRNCSHSCGIRGSSVCSLKRRQSDVSALNFTMEFGSSIKLSRVFAMNTSNVAW